MRLAKWVVALTMVIAFAPSAFAGNSDGGGAHKANIYNTSSYCDWFFGFVPGSPSGSALGFATLNSNGEPGLPGKDLLLNLQLMNGDPNATYKVDVCSESETTPVHYGMFTTDQNGHGHLNASMMRNAVSSASPDQFFVHLRECGSGPNSNLATPAVTVD